MYTDDPETGRKARKKGKLINTDPRTVGYMAVDSEEDMIVVFCDESRITCNAGIESII